jgi:uncharacterized protein (TIGR02466 family)
MQILNLFPVQFFEFHNKSIDNRQLIQLLDQQQGMVRHGSVISYLENIHTLDTFSEIFTWFNNCLETVRAELNYNCDKFEITNSWFNKALANRGMHQNYHRHTMSFFSAVYYLTEGAPTAFEDPMIQRTQAQIEVLRKNYTPFEQIKAVPGKLIIFPSWVYHQTPPHLENYDRYIISFNSLPTGKINTIGGSDSACYISIKETND